MGGLKKNGGEQAIKKILRLEGKSYDRGRRSKKRWRLGKNRELEITGPVTWKKGGEKGGLAERGYSSRSKGALIKY